MRIASFSPVPPETSGIADYVALLLPELRKHLEVEVVKRRTRRPPRGVDLAVYHIGNNPDAHGWILDALRRAPGAVVLHDFVLHHLVAGVTIGRRDGHGYLDAMEREHGVVGRLLGHGVLDKRLPPLWEVRPEEFPLAGEVLGLATGLVVHSHHVEERARAAGYDGLIARVPHPAWPDPQVSPAAIEGTPVIGSFGNVNTSKRIPQLLEAFARLRREHPQARLLLAGAVSPGFDLDRRLQRLGLDDAGIVREGHVSERKLWELMAGCDVHVSLRSPTMGETSGTAIRALTLGKPLVVSDVGWFSELPDGAALKVSVGAREVDDLTAALRLLVERPEARERMAVAARALARGEHDLARVAERQAAAFERIAGGGAVADEVLRDVSRAAAGVGIAPGSAEASEIARRLSESIGPIPTFYLTQELDLGKVSELRGALTQFGDEFKVSFNDVILKAVATALSQHPEVNAHWLGDKIRYHNRVHLGMAVATDDGLIVPVIFAADQKRMSEISAEAKQLAKAARERKLKPEQYTGSTFSVSNLGMFGIDQFTAIINPPEVGILAIGAVEDKAVVVDGKVEVRKRLRLTMSCDHRVIDGAVGAKFLQTLRRMLENPLMLVY